MKIRRILPLIFLFLGRVQAEIPAIDSPKILEERQNNDISSLIGLKIARIDVVGFKLIEEKTIRFKISAQVGEPLTSSKARKDLKAIFETGFFENVLAYGKKEGEGVVLTYRVVEKPALQNVEIVGNHSISTEKLLKLIDLSSKEALRPKAIQEAAEKIRQEYNKHGYYYVTVQPKVQKIEEDESKIVFQVDEGDKLRLESVEFVGNQSFGAGTRFWGLKRKLKKTREHWWLSFLFKSGKYSPDTVEEDLAALKEFYINHGFLDIKIGEPQIQIDEASKGESLKRLHLKIPIEEGVRYRVGEITVEGNSVFKTEAILRAFTSPSKQREIQKGIFSTKDKVLTTGEWFSLDALKGGVSNVQDMYGNSGYIYANIFPDRKQDPKRQIVDLNILITEDQVAYVRSIEFKGNTRTRDKVLRREMAILEGDVFKTSLFRYSLSRLQALGYITELTPEVKPAENRRDLDIAIKLSDNRQTELQMGGGYRSPDGLFGTMSISEHNFLGYGQELNFSIAASKKTQNYDFSFSEPYLMDTSYSGAVSLFRQDLAPTSFRNYRERQTGGRLSLGKYLKRQIQARVSYGFQVTKLSEFATTDDNANLLALAGLTSTSSVTFSAARDSLNNRRDPTGGNSSYLSAELAGLTLGGDNNYFKLEGQTIQYFSLRGKLTYALRGRMSFAGSFLGHELPFVERYRLGGERSVRGFENFAIGPLNQNGDNLGGNKEFLVNQEVIIPLADPLRVVLFLDAGNVFSDQQGYNLAKLRKSAGVEIRFFIPQFWVPIRFIWGWKLDKKENEQPSNFTFSIGTTF